MIHSVCPYKHKEISPRQLDLWLPKHKCYFEQICKFSVLLLHLNRRDTLPLAWIHCIAFKRHKFFENLKCWKKLCMNLIWEWSWTSEPGSELRGKGCTMKIHLMYSIQEKAAFFFLKKHFLELLWGFCPQFKAQRRSVTFCKLVLITVGVSLTEKKGLEQDVLLHILLLSFYNNITIGLTQPLLTLRNEYFYFKGKGQYQDTSKWFPSLVSHSFVQQEQTFLALPVPKHYSKDLGKTNKIGGMLEVISYSLSSVFLWGDPGNTELFC